jgi:hypothetical protein
LRGQQRRDAGTPETIEQQQHQPAHRQAHEQEAWQRVREVALG